MARILNALALGAWGLWSLAAQAEPFYDPTRPPDAFMPNGSTAGAAQPVVRSLVLQSVILSPQRRLAVISGVQVAVGQSIDGYQLQRLTSDEAQLLGPKGALTLKLVPTDALSAVRAPAAKPLSSLRGESK